MSTVFCADEYHAYASGILSRGKLKKLPLYSQGHDAEALHWPTLVCANIGAEKPAGVGAGQIAPFLLYSQGHRTTMLKPCTGQL